MIIQQKTYQIICIIKNIMLSAELKLKWKEYCVLFAICVENVNANSSNIIFTIKETNYMFLL